MIRAANVYEPHQVGNYLKELAALFHGWYNEHKVLGDDAELTQARLLLSVNVQQVLRNGLNCSVCLHRLPCKITREVSTCLEKRNAVYLNGQLSQSSP